MHAFTIHKATDFDHVVRTHAGDGALVGHVQRRVDGLTGFDPFDNAERDPGVALVGISVRNPKRRFAGLTIVHVGSDAMVHVGVVGAAACR